MGVGNISKRILLGRKLRSAQLGETLLPKRIALPVFASDALSSVAYAPDEVFIMLSLSGTALYAFSWKIGILVGLVMLTVVASYRQNVHAYPSGGGDYEVATVNLGSKAGTTVASALLVDYVLTVAVSVSSGVQNAGSAIPFMARHSAVCAVILVLLLAAMNLRGVRESGSTFAVPVYGFMVGVLGMAAYAGFRALSGDLPNVASASYHIAKAPGYDSAISTGALIFLLARAFASGCAALTGVEAISNGVPAFRKPKSKNAATTLFMLGAIAVTMLMSIIVLAREMGLKYVDPTDPAAMSRLTDAQGHHFPASFDEHTVIAQIARAVFDNFPPGFYFVVAMTGIILVLAANTSFNGFPVLGSILARDGFMPRQLGARGDRLAYSNGILILAGFAIILIIAFDAQPTRLIQLYIVGVFVSFTCSQAGMIRHWNRKLRTEQDGAVRRRMRRSQLINTVGLTCTSVVLVIVVVTKFLAGAWIAIAAMAAIFMLMTGIRKHYDRVAEELRAQDQHAVLPARNHAIVLVSTLHLPTMRALAYARATRPDVLEAVTVNVDDASTRELTRQWDSQEIQVALKVVESPYREITRPVLEYVRRVRSDNPRDVVTVFLPEYVVGHWWEQLLHNQSALRLKGRLLFQPGVMVTSVPWQLASSRRAFERAKRRTLASAPGSVRRGLNAPIRKNNDDEGRT